MQEDVLNYIFHLAYCYVKRESSRTKNMVGPSTVYPCTVQHTTHSDHNITTLFTSEAVFREGNWRRKDLVCLRKPGLSMHTTCGQFIDYVNVQNRWARKNGQRRNGAF